MPFVDLTNKKFNRLTAIKVVRRDTAGNCIWLCRCDCGNKLNVRGYSLRQGRTKSCGCWKIERMHKLGKASITHGMSRSSEFNIWQSMKNRCKNKTKKEYKNYGGRGIKVCEEWLKFENFYRDMGKKPRGMSIDRIDNNKGYSKRNCHWATYKENNRNRRDNKMVTYRKQTLCVGEWAEKLDLQYSTLKNRLSKWSIEKAFTYPLRGKNNFNNLIPQQL